jgi:hypothetical protein
MDKGIVELSVKKEEAVIGKPEDNFPVDVFRVGTEVDIGDVKFAVQRINYSTLVLRPVSEHGLSARKIMNIIAER